MSVPLAFSKGRSQHSPADSPVGEIFKTHTVARIRSSLCSQVVFFISLFQLDVLACAVHIQELPKISENMVKREA